MADKGRPTKYENIDLVQVEKLAKLGLIDREIADILDISERTFNNYKKKHDEFLQSLKRGKEISDRLVVKSLFQRAIGYSHREDKIFNNNGEPLIVPTIKNYPPDTTAAIFWLKNRIPDDWRDKQEIDHTSKGKRIDGFNYVKPNEADNKATS